MRHQVIVPKKVQKELDRIPTPFRQRIIVALSVIGNNPYCAKKLEGEHKGEWSFVVWPYRIIYRIKKQGLIILVVKIGHRQGVY